MNKPKRLASVLVLLVAFLMLFSVLFIALEADHDCCGVRRCRRSADHRTLPARRQTPLSFCAHFWIESEVFL